MKYFTSDTHFGHSAIIGYCNRPFKDPEHMTEELIRLWNETVGPNDEVYHLGDFGLTNTTKLCAILERLNGHKHFIRGNHDDGMKGEALRYWVTVQDYKEVYHNDTRLVLCHFPFERWHKSHRGSIHLHGHCHGDLPSYNRRLDVGVDVHGYRPISGDHILSLMKDRPNTDHHD